MGIDWRAEDDFTQDVFNEADRIRSAPGHGLSDRQVYAVAGSRVIEARVMLVYRIALWFFTALTIYVGAQTWYASGSFRDSLAPMAITVLVFNAVAFRLTRRQRWAGFSTGPYAGVVESAARRAQGGVHLLTLSGMVAVLSLVFYVLCVSWAFPL
ncbi:hypothetical protein [Streptomyces sp. BH105]|uniref:hypothetical protein n=1 Tax=Streptomyces sp. BH105 TaxID=3410408 RepID=UPI003CECDBC6